MLREEIGAKLISATKQFRLFDLKYSPNNELLEQYNFLHRLSDDKFDYLWYVHQTAAERGGIIDGYL